jgi:hypothetical protein
VRSSQFSSGVISSSGSGDERIGDEDLDPKLLLWDMHRNIDHAAVPDGRTVVQFRFPDAVWRGDLGWPNALRSGAVEVHGPEALRRAMPRWFTLSAFASVPRLPDARSARIAPRAATCLRGTPSLGDM